MVDIDATYPAPGAAPAILGLAAMRSRVATVVDARRLLGLPAAHGEGGARAVVTAVGGHLYAIAVDTLEDVACFDIAARPTGLGRIGDVVSGVAEGDGETLLVLDIDRLIDAIDAIDMPVNENVTLDPRWRRKTSVRA
ncbi:chemotaxis protein CheW [Sphingomonas sp. MMS24-JH45]